MDNEKQKGDKKEDKTPKEESEQYVRRRIQQRSSRLSERGLGEMVLKRLPPDFPPNEDRKVVKDKKSDK